MRSAHGNEGFVASDEARTSLQGICDAYAGYHCKFQCLDRHRPAENPRRVSRRSWLESWLVERCASGERLAHGLGGGSSKAAPVFWMNGRIEPLETYLKDSKMALELPQKM